MTKCKECGQPMLPKGKAKRDNEYDHASRCPLGADPDGKHLDAFLANEISLDEFHARLRRAQ